MRLFTITMEYYATGEGITRQVIALGAEDAVVNLSSHFNAS
jgi:hypothetical protein